MFDLPRRRAGLHQRDNVPDAPHDAIQPVAFGFLVRIEKADRRLAGPLFCIFRRASGVAWEGELTPRGTSCCILRKALGLNKLFELVGHGVDVGVRDNEGRQEAQRMGSGVVEHQALRRVEGG